MQRLEPRPKEAPLVYCGARSVPKPAFLKRRHTCLPNPQRKAQDPPTMPRDTSNTTTKARNSKYAAATGLKTGNLKVKGAPPEPLSQRRRD